MVEQFCAHADYAQLIRIMVMVSSYFGEYYKDDMMEIADKLDKDKDNG